MDDIPDELVFWVLLGYSPEDLKTHQTKYQLRKNGLPFRTHLPISVTLFKHLRLTGRRLWNFLHPYDIFSIPMKGDPLITDEQMESEIPGHASYARNGRGRRRAAAPPYGPNGELRITGAQAQVIPLGGFEPVAKTCTIFQHFCWKMGPNDRFFYVVHVDPHWNRPPKPGPFPVRYTSLFSFEDECL